MKTLFVLVCSLSGFFFGSFLGSATLPKGSGLAGPATVLFYGLIGALITALLSIFLVRKIERKLIIKITIILALLNLIPIGWVVYRFVTVTSQTQKEEPKKLTPTQIRGSLISLFLSSSKIYGETEMGLGMVKPDFYNRKVIYFYGFPNLEKPVSDHKPTDSLVFMQTEHNQIDISYAPPWFYPEHQKLDYDILYFKLLTMNRDWVQVELNKKTGQSAWMSRNDVSVLLWQEFLLNVFSIENLDPKSNLLRIKPLVHASEVMIKEYEIMAPVMIKDSWLKVNLFDKDFNIVGEAWLQWQYNGRLMITYSLLS
ncbi:MAG: hypothetical protein IT276_01255 [Ignavibacteriaceae bacterium]|nr:hypothetical protein [Ignavibacterium sp.]MCC6253519.1 hypothetical protein [Ignavibacteriaceae bacterium]HRP91853.1 hypothetical protein [Ignavibacteriaceae bacterium]